MFSLFKIHTETIGLDVGKHALRAVQLKYPGQHARVRATSYVDLPKKIFDKDTISDPGALQACIQNLIEQGSPHPLTAKAVVAALPESFIFTKVIQLPNIPPQELQKAVAYEAEQYLPIPIKDVYFDFIPLALHSDKKLMDTALFAAPRNLVDGLIEAIHGCKLELYALETKSTAITRALFLHGSTETAAIVEIGSESTRVTVYDHSNVWLTTSMNTGEIQLMKSLSEQMSVPEAELRLYLEEHHDKLPEATLSKVVAPIIQEILSVIRYHETRDYEARKVNRVIITGQGAMIPGVTPAIISNLQIPCQTGLPLVTAPQPLPLMFTTAAGLAMRQL